MLTFASSSAMAEWVKFIEDDKETRTIYVDSTTIRKNGNNVKMLILSDYKKAQELAYLPLYMSIKKQNEFNCKEELMKKLYASYHAKSMGEGEVIFSDNNPDNWSKVLPDFIDKKLWEFACGK